VTAAAATRTGHIGVVATAGTVESGAYPAAINEADPKLVVRQQACPDLVPLVEDGKLEGPEPERTLAGYLGPLLDGDPLIDTLLLGCTHYPLLRPLIERQVGPTVAVVDSAFTSALAAEDLLDALGARSPADPEEPGVSGSNRIATTGDVAAFTSVAERLFGARLPAVEAAEVAQH
jgi:glutamate racemase